MKTPNKIITFASVAVILSTVAVGSTFAQVTAPGAGTASTPALRPIPSHVDKPGDHPRGPAKARPDAVIGAGADNPQYPAKRPIPPHVEKPGDHPRGAPNVKPDLAAGADNPQIPAHVDKPGKQAHPH